MRFKNLCLALSCVLCFGSFCSCKDGGKRPSSIIKPLTVNLQEKESRQLRDAEKVDWLEYNEKFLSYPFFSNRNDEVTYAANAIYDKYGYIQNKPGDAVMWFGTEPTWYEWIS